jgi:tetratricopeptide (TPR) repeat protein
MTQAVTRMLFATAAAVVLAAGYLSVQTFVGRYYFVSSFRGLITGDEHERYLRSALQHDPSLGYGNMALARVMIRRGAYGAALACQETGMKSFNSVRGHEQLGTILDKLGRTQDAEDTFSRALSMHPDDVVALERLAKLAYEAGASERVNDLTDQILRLELNNINAYYLRAKDAERQANWSRAFLNYQMVSALSARSKRVAEQAFFDPREIEERLLDIRKILPTE